MKLISLNLSFPNKDFTAFQDIYKDPDFSFFFPKYVSLGYLAGPDKNKPVIMSGGRVGLVVRALAFHQCGPGSISALGVIRGLSLLVLYSAMRGFSPGTPVFPSPQKPAFD